MRFHTNARSIYPDRLGIKSSVYPDKLGTTATTREPFCFSVFLSHLHIKTNILPRQARDSIGKTQKRVAFCAGVTASTNDLVLDGAQSLARIDITAPESIGSASVSPSASLTVHRRLLRPKGGASIVPLGERDVFPDEQV